MSAVAIPHSGDPVEEAANMACSLPIGNVVVFVRFDGIVIGSPEEREDFEDAVLASKRLSEPTQSMADVLARLKVHKSGRTGN